MTNCSNRKLINLPGPALFEEVTYLGSCFEDSISFKIGCTVSRNSFWNRKQWQKALASPERAQFDKTPRKHKRQLSLHRAHWEGSIPIQQQQCVFVWEIAHIWTHTKIYTTHLRNVSNLRLSPLFPRLAGSSAGSCRGRLDSVIDYVAEFLQRTSLDTLHLFPHKTAEQTEDAVHTTWASKQFHYWMRL